MNVTEAMGVIALAGAVGGFVHGLITADGVILPMKPETRTFKIKDSAGVEKEVTQTLWSLGVIGQVIIGAVAAVLVWCIYSQPELDISVKTDVRVALYQMGTALAAGLGGTKAINDLVDKKQWAQLAPVLQRTDPAAPPVTGVRALQAFRQLGTK